MTSTGTLTLTDFLWARFDEDGHAAQQAGAMDNTPGAAARFDRAQREVSAKRDIAREHAGVGGICRTCGVMTPETGERWPCRTLRLLAFPYLDHPDMREEWRP